MYVDELTSRPGSPSRTGSPVSTSTTSTSTPGGGDPATIGPSPGSMSGAITWDNTVYDSVQPYMLVNTASGATTRRPARTSRPYSGSPERFTAWTVGIA